ncbi:MAG TPA: hypothetical protein VKB69_10715 [Micromonosporaceae bacterium]|nr:hypothetical protein [Micromonosporaceae bacterium]
MGGFRVARAVPALMIAVALAAGCSSGSNSSPSTPATPPSTPSPTATATGAVCAAASDLKTAVNRLASINVASGGLSSVQAALADVSAKLDAFQAAAHNDFGPQVSAMRNALSKLRTALASASGSPSVSTIAGVATSVGDVVASYNSLRASVATVCG